MCFENLKPLIPISLAQYIYDLSCNPLGPFGSAYMHPFRSETRLGGREKRRIGLACVLPDLQLVLWLSPALHHTKTLQSRWLAENKEEKGGRFPWGP